MAIELQCEMTYYVIFCFFFQAEDGIRDSSVTGVRHVLFRSTRSGRGSRRTCGTWSSAGSPCGSVRATPDAHTPRTDHRSEERRVWTQARTRWGESGGEKKGSGAGMRILDRGCEPQRECRDVA